MRKNSIVFAALACLFLHSSIYAAPLTFQFTGTVTQIVTDPADPFGASIGFGTPVTGFFTFDSAAPDGAADPSTGSYTSIGAPFGLQMLIAGFAFPGDSSLNVGVGNDFGGTTDFYTLFASGSSQISVTMMDPSGAVFADTSLPLTPPDIAAFLTRTFHLDTEVDGNIVQIDGTIDSLTMESQVPEPHTYVTISIAIGLGLLRRRK